MKKFILSFVLALFLAGNAFAAVVSKSFTAVGAGPTLSVKVGDSFDYSVSGTFSGTVLLQRSTNQFTWTTVATATGSTSGTVIASSNNANQVAYRFWCDAYTSGTIVTSMTDATGYVTKENELKNRNGDTIFYTNESGAVVQNLTVTGTTTGITAAGDDTVYGAGWDGSTTVPTQNAIYDKIETISASASQWTTSGSDIYFSSGKTSIGTTTSRASTTVQETASFDTVYNFNGTSTYTNNTTEAKSTFGTAFTVMFDSTQILYLGKTSSTFTGLSALLKTYTTSTITMNATYWNGSSWAALTKTDNTTSFSTSGTITWTAPGDWATTTVNGTSGYWIALQFATSPSTAVTVYNIKPTSTPAFSVLANAGDTTSHVVDVLKGQIQANGAALSQPQTFVIGLASSRNGHNADFVCAGAKDSVCINQAITACGSSPCNLILLEGTFNITSCIGVCSGTGVPLINNLTIAGQGPGKTIIKSSNITSATIQDTTNPTTGSPLTNLTIRDLEIDRSSDTKDASIGRKAVFIKYLSNMRINNTYMHDSGATCIGTDFINGGFITNNWLVGCGTSTATTGSSGVGIGTGEYATEPMIISNNVITGSGLAGILIEAQGGATAGTSNNFILADNIITGGPQYGIVVRGTSNVLITGNKIRSNTKDGVLIDDYASQLVTNVSVVANDINDNTLYGVNIADAGGTKLTVRDNNLTNNGSGAMTTNLTTITELSRFGNKGDTVNYVDASLIVTPPAAQTIAGGDIVTADACGSIKRISSAGSVTTSTTNTFTAPAAANAGCLMMVCNSGANTITLDNNSNFKSFGGLDVAVTADDCVGVASSGASGVWYQTTGLEAN